MDNYLCIKDKIFDMWMCELLSLCIISQRMDGVQLCFQLAQQVLINLS